MKKRFDIIDILFVCLLAVIFGYSLGSSHQSFKKKYEAFERGHMVQCIGKSGYYWECE